jgi:ABC-type amino acid transport substrate-binding protein
LVAQKSFKESQTAVYQKLAPKRPSVFHSETDLKRGLLVQRVERKLLPRKRELALMLFMFFRNLVALFSFTLFTGLAFAVFQPVIIASLVEFPPTSWTEGSVVKGSYVDFLKALGKRAEFKIEIQAFPFLRAADKVRVGSAELTIAPLTAATSKIGGDRIFLYKHRYFLVSRKRKPFCSLQEVRGEIGRLRGGCSDLLDEKKVKFFEVASYDQGLTMLQKGRLNGFCGVEEGLSYWMKQMPLDTKTLEKFLIAERDTFILFSPHFNKAYFEKIEKAAKALIAEGALQKIQDEYNVTNGFLHQPDCKAIAKNSSMR